MENKQAGVILSPSEKKMFETEGYLVVKQLLSEDEVEDIRTHFMRIHENGPIPGFFHPVSVEEAEGEPLKLYPRILFPHRFSDKAKNYMVHPRVMDILTVLFEEEPLAAQSMFYFKPPGSRGQAIHQDNYYLRVEPGTCIACWIAIDDAVQENGGLVVVPRSNRLEIQCPHEADSTQSFFRDEVDVPEGLQIVPVDLASGDALFFNGSLIHGSYPNRSADRFRRSFISHYVGTSTVRLGYHICDDLYNSHGEIVKREPNRDAGPCGVEVDETH